MVDELFLDTSFIGSLAPLKQSVAEACDHRLESFPKFSFTASPLLGSGRPELEMLNKLIYRVERALAYPEWRKRATSARNSFMAEVIGQEATAECETVPNSLVGMLQKLQAVVAAIAPVDDAVVKQKRLVAELMRRRSFEQRLMAYGEASLALKECITVGELAEQQVMLLQKRLHSSATAWRQKSTPALFPQPAWSLWIPG